MSTKVAIAVLAALVLGTAGCQNVRETTGAGIGAVIGAAAGSRIGEGSGKTVATAVGAAVGLMVGASIGRKLDEHARMTAERATTRALDTAETGHTITWEDPNSGGSGGPAKGTVTVTKQGVHDDGRTCREFVNTVEVNGQKEEVTRVACRNPGEGWKVQEA